MVSVVIPVYNGEAYLRECLESISSQTYRDLEILVIDDGSSDASAQIAEEREKTDCRVKLIRQKHFGVSAARNCGIEKSKGEYVLFCDCDDILRKDGILSLLEAMERTGADIAIGNYIYLLDYYRKLEKPSQWLEDKTYVEKERYGCIHFNCILGNKLFKKSFLENNRLCFGPYHMGEDLCFYHRSLAAAEIIATISRCTYVYRLHEGSTSYTYSLRDLDYIPVFREIEALYKSRPETAEWVNELLYDRLFYYLRTLKRLPRFKNKKNRKKVMEAYIHEVETLNLTSAKHRKEIMKLANQILFIKKWRKVYESNLFAMCYQAVRFCGRWVKKVIK